MGAELIVVVLVCIMIFLLFASYDRGIKPPSTSLKEPPETIPAAFDADSAKLQTEQITLDGLAYVIDGDSLVIRKTQVRLFGIDAPEMNHPYGKKAKWALFSMCKGQIIRAEVIATDDYGRVVARCFLQDGRDLSAEMVKQGLAIDWPKFSGGEYRCFEQPDIRKKLWPADARQKGRMHVWKEYEAKQAVRTNNDKQT